MVWAWVKFKHGTEFEGWLSPNEIAELKHRSKLGGVRVDEFEIKEKSNEKTTCRIFG